MLPDELPFTTHLTALMRNMAAMDDNQRRSWMQWMAILGTPPDDPRLSELVDRWKIKDMGGELPRIVAASGRPDVVQRLVGRVDWTSILIPDEEFEQHIKNRYLVRNAHKPMAPIPNHERSWVLSHTHAFTAHSSTEHAEALSLVDLLLKQQQMTPDSPVSCAWMGAPVDLKTLGLLFSWPQDGVLKELWKDSTISDPTVTAIAIASQVLGVDTRPGTITAQVWEEVFPLVDWSREFTLPAAWAQRWKQPSMNVGAVFCSIVCSETRNSNPRHTSMVEQVAMVLQDLNQVQIDQIVLEVCAVLAGEEEDSKARSGRAARVFYETLLPKCSPQGLKNVVQTLCGNVIQGERKSMLWNVLAKQPALKHTIDDENVIDDIFASMLQMAPLIQGQKVRTSSYESWWNHKEDAVSKIVSWVAPVHAQKALEHLSNIREAFAQANTTTTRWKHDSEPSASFLKLAVYQDDPKAWRQHNRARLKM